MPISLHAATIPSMVQIHHAAKGWIDKAQASGLDEAELIASRLVEDMLPLSYQFKSMAVHSMGAFEGVKNGVFHPDRSEPPASFAGLKALLDEAIAYLSALTEDEVEAMAEGPMRFEVGERRVPFTRTDFLLTLSQPSFYFHATTAYDILRARGVAVGKRDFLGAMRVLA